MARYTPESLLKRFQSGGCVCTVRARKQWCHSIIRRHLLCYFSYFSVTKLHAWWGGVDKQVLHKCQQLGSCDIWSKMTYGPSIWNWSSKSNV